MHDYETGRIYAEPDAASRLPMNQSKAYIVIQEFYDTPNFHDYVLIQRTSTVIVGPPPSVTGNKSTLMNIISVIFVRPVM